MADNKQSRPITLHVSKISFETPPMEHVSKPVIQPVYVEMNIHDATELVVYLTKRIEKGLTGRIGFQLHAHVEL